MAENAKKGSSSESKDGKDPVVPAAVSKSKLRLILGALALVVVSAGIPTTFFILKGKAVVSAEQLAVDAANEDAAPMLAEGHDDEEVVGDDEERLGAILPLETFLINLDGGRYLRAQVQLEFVGPTVPNAYVRNQVVARDGLISLMSRKKSEDIAIVRGRDVMKGEIRDLINEILKHQEVKRVFFTQFVIQ